MVEITATLTTLDWPAWVQAVCSIATIAVTILLFRRQEGEHARETAIAHGEFVANVKYVLKQSRKQFDDAHGHTRHAIHELRGAEKPAGERRQDWEGGLFMIGASVRAGMTFGERLVAIPVTSWPSPDLYLLVRNAHSIRQSLVAEPLVQLLDPARDVSPEDYVAELEHIERLLMHRAVRYGDGAFKMLAERYAEDVGRRTTGASPIPRRAGA